MKNIGNLVGLLLWRFCILCASIAHMGYVHFWWVNKLRFLKGVYYSLFERDRNVFIGFRRFKRFQRDSYDEGINFFLDKMNSRCVEEPRNVLFNSLLDEVDKRYGIVSSETKTNLAVYHYLNKTL